MEQVSAHYRWSFKKILHKIPFSQTLLYFSSLYAYLTKTNPFGGSDPSSTATEEKPKTKDTPMTSAQVGMALGNQAAVVLQHREEMPEHIRQYLDQLEREGQL